MWTIASQSFANGLWTITAEEPATLPLALVGIGTLAVYAVFAGWRPRRAVEAKIRVHQPSIEAETRRAA